MHNNFEQHLKSEWDISDNGFKLLSDSIKLRTIKKGEFLLKAGEISKSLFFVEKGLLRVFFLGKNEKIGILEFASENVWMGDRGSFYFNEPTSFYMDAIEESTVVVVDREFIDLILKIKPSAKKNSEKLLQNQIRHLNKRVGLLLVASAETRYLNFIKLHPDILNRVPQWMIASYRGIAPESLSRVRKNLVVKGFERHRID